jgi:hypothetical protein
MPLDHSCITVPVSKFDDMVSFFLTSFADLGFKELMRPIPTAVGFGEESKPYFWINTVPNEGKELLEALRVAHIAFQAESMFDFFVSSCNLWWWWW